MYSCCLQTTARTHILACYRTPCYNGAAQIENRFTCDTQAGKIVNTICGDFIYPSYTDITATTAKLISVNISSLMYKSDRWADTISLPASRSSNHESSAQQVNRLLQRDRRTLHAFTTLFEAGSWNWVTKQRFWPNPTRRSLTLWSLWWPDLVSILTHAQHACRQMNIIP